MHPMPSNPAAREASAQSRKPSKSATSLKTESIACTPAACAAFTTRDRAYCDSPPSPVFTLGLEDYTADLGVVKTAEGRESQYARSRVGNAAHAAGKAGVGSGFHRVRDLG